MTPMTMLLVRFSGFVTQALSLLSEDPHCSDSLGAASAADILEALRRL